MSCKFIRENASYRWLANLLRKNSNLLQKMQVIDEL